MVVDCHTHTRDFNQSDEETIAHALEVAEDSDVAGIFAMPNTNPPIISREMVEKSIEIADSCNSPVFFGLYIGLTPDKKQVGEAVELWREFPQVIGLKMYAGESVGGLTVKKIKDQKMVYKQLSNFGYGGVLAVHCEKESEMNSDLFDPEAAFANGSLISHNDARPEKAETESIKDQIEFAKEGKYMGKLHIVHVSTPESVELVKKAKAEKLVRISCGVTPGHLLLDNEIMMGKDGILYKVNPPLRSPETREELFECFLRGDMDILETDHAPHTYKGKTEKHLSGLPGLASWPDFLGLLKGRGASESLLEKMSHDNVNRIFGTNIQRKNFKIKSRVGDYAFNPYASLVA